MTKADILTKAWEAGLIYKKDNEWLFDPSADPRTSILWFAEELIFSEREACAKLCDASTSIVNDYTVACNECAWAIRERGKT